MNKRRIHLNIMFHLVLGEIVAYQRGGGGDGPTVQCLLARDGRSKERGLLIGAGVLPPGRALRAQTGADQT